MFKFLAVLVKIWNLNYLKNLCTLMLILNKIAFQYFLLLCYWCKFVSCLKSLCS